MLHPSVALDLANQRLEELRAEARRDGRARDLTGSPRRSRRARRAKRHASHPRPAVS
jgi:hypothetical protein